MWNAYRVPSRDLEKLRIAYGEAIRELSQQEGTLVQSKTRTGTLMAFVCGGDGILRIQ